MNLDRDDRELVKLVIEQSIRSRKKRAQMLIKMKEKRESTYQSLASAKPTTDVNSRYQ